MHLSEELNNALSIFVGFRWVDRLSLARNFVRVVSIVNYFTNSQKPVEIVNLFAKRVTAFRPRPAPCRVIY